MRLKLISIDNKIKRDIKKRRPTAKPTAKKKRVDVYKENLKFVIKMIDGDTNDHWHHIEAP